MDTIDIEVKIDRTVDVKVDVYSVIQAINDVPMTKRWNYIAQIINGVHMDLSDTTVEQKDIIKKYLTDKIKLF